jgi:hypothetical protein
MNKTGKRDIRKTSGTMERFCSVISVTVLSRPNTGKDDNYYY